MLRKGKPAEEAGRKEGGIIISDPAGFALAVCLFLLFAMVTVGELL